MSRSFGFFLYNLVPQRSLWISSSEFAESFYKKNSEATPYFGDSPYHRFVESATLCISEPRSRRLPVSLIAGSTVNFLYQISPWIRSQHRKGFNSRARNLCQTDLYKKIEKSSAMSNDQEKRGGLKVVALDRSDFKLFTLRFSNKLVQAPSRERPKTAQRNLFLSFEINIFPKNGI